MLKHSGIAEEIVSIVGYPAAARLFSHYGGRQVKIPNGGGKAGLFVARLIELLGEDGYKSLIERFGGEQLTIPKGKPAALIARNRQIVADYTAGASMLDLIQRYDLCQRQIRSILNRPIDQDAPSAEKEHATRSI